MGCLEAAYCLDCLESFYTDSKYMVGYPSLSEELKPNPNSYDEYTVGDRVNFGYLKKGLTPLKMNTVDFVSYDSFLNKHKNHRMYLFNDHADDFPPELINENGEFLDHIDNFKYSEEDFVEKFYEIHCNTCDETTRLGHKRPLKIIPFEPFNITDEILDKAKKFSILSDSVSFDNFVSSFDLFYESDNIFNFSSFLDIHSEHELVVRLSCDFNSENIVSLEYLREQIKVKYPEKKSDYDSTGGKTNFMECKILFQNIQRS